MKSSISYTLQQAIKSLADRFVALIMLVLLSPILMLIAIAIVVQMGYPILFVQPRPGYRHQIFKFFKLRTMSDERDALGELLPDHERLLPFGQFLRQTSLDELPQLWNVLRGDMSFVGPRPLLVQYLDRYTPEQARRHEVKPGITGWAQIHGRRELDGNWEEKFRLDVWYVDHWSLGLDFKILLATVFKVLRQEGISQTGQVTGEEFFGTPVSKSLR
jgi:lipopolysaccharide/colanic/teichoic acid biosynthesis glycosyltransferase